MKEGDERSTRRRSWVEQNQIVAYFAGAYLFSWVLWAPSVLSNDAEALVTVLLFSGVFGPWASAALVTRLSGGSVKGWMRSISRFRVARRLYAYALLVPIAIISIASVAMAIAGVDLDLALLGDERLAIFLPTLVACVLINGGPEEPGWRGFALPRMQERMSPVRATFTLGGLWACWHLPLLLISEQGVSHGLDALPFAAIVVCIGVGIAFGYSVFYTYLWNRSGSVIPSILLHASFNAANGVFLLIPENLQRGSTYALIAVCQTAVLLIAAGLLIWRTDGRLGATSEDREATAATRYRSALRVLPSVPR